MLKYQENALARIRKGLRRMSAIVDRAIKEDYKEADTRKIVSDMLCEYLGWDKFENVTAEQMIGSRYADYVVKTSDEEVFVVEVKQIGLKLKESHLNQARQYAVDEGIDWCVLTNGDEWQAYRTELVGKIPKTSHVFTVRLSDPDMKPADKASLFYLLSEEANRKKEIEDYYGKHAALTGGSLARTILDEPVITAIRRAIKNDKNQKLQNSEIQKALIKRLFSSEVVEAGEDEFTKIVKKTERAERAKAK